MKGVDEQLWKNFRGALSGNGVIRSIGSAAPGTKTYGFEDASGQGWSLSVRTRTSYVLGIDIVGYSRRSQDAQLFLTTWVFEIIKAAVEQLRKIGWLPADQPSVLISTGDGAMLVWDDPAYLQFAMAMLFCVNMWIEDITRRYAGRGVAESLNRSQPYPILPIHCRYVLAKGEIIPMLGLDGSPNGVGTALVTCARLLAASKGAHLLVQSEVMDDLDQHGGIEGVRAQGEPWDWHQSFHCALMSEASVKTAKLRFYNVFGKYRPVPLYTKLGLSREDVEGAPTYNIGSHDVSTIVD